MNRTKYFRTSSFSIYDGTRVYSADWSYDGKQWFSGSKYFESELEAKFYIDDLIRFHNSYSNREYILDEQECGDYRKKFPSETYQWWDDTCKE